MKRKVISIVLLFLIVFLVGCEGKKICPNNNHVFDEGVINNSQKVYTCDKCGYQRTEEIEQIGDGKSYLLKLYNNREYLQEALPKNVESGSKVLVKTRILLGATIEIYANEQKIEKSKEAFSDHWEYEFIMPKEDVNLELKVVMTEKLGLDGEYSGKLVARREVLVPTDCYITITENHVKFGEDKILPLDIVKIKEQHGLSFDFVSYCEKDAEEAVRRIVEMDEYYIFTGYMSIVDAISKYYIFDVDGTLFYIHTVDIKDSPLQQLSMYELVKEDIK